MATSLTVIEKRIEALTSQAEKLRKARGTVLKRLRQDVKRFGFTASDLFGSAAGVGEVETKPKLKKSSMNGKKVPPKYRDGDQVWTGRGSMPKWLRAALAAGRELDSFLIDKGTATKAAIEAKPVAVVKTPKTPKTPKASKASGKQASKAKPVAASKVKIAAPAGSAAGAAKPAAKAPKKPGTSVAKTVAKAPAVKKSVAKKTASKAPAGKKVASGKASKSASGQAATSVSPGGSPASTETSQ